MKTNDKANLAALKLQEIIVKIDAIENGKLSVNAAERTELFGEIRDATNDIVGFLCNHLKYYQPAQS